MDNDSIDENSHFSASDAGFGAMVPATRENGAGSPLRRRQKL
jgi:hypothetical protein